MSAAVFCFKRKVCSGDVQIHLMPAASHNYGPEPTAGICVNWEDHAFCLSLPVLGVISFCTNSKCFLFNVCFDTCFPAPLKLRGNGSLCHLRTWISLGAIFVSGNTMGEFATGLFVFFVATSWKEYNRTKFTQ